jgi:hypothetical protein
VVAGGQRGQEPGDIVRAEVGGMAQLVVGDEAARSVAVGLFGAKTEVSGAAGGAQAIHEFRWRHAAGTAKTVPWGRRSR